MTRITDEDRKNKTSRYVERTSRIDSFVEAS